MIDGGPTRTCGRVAVIAIFDDGDVDIDDVP